MVKHAVRLHKLDNSWNCRLEKEKVNAGIEGFLVVYSLNVLSNNDKPESDGASIITTCGGHGECHILHGHWLEYP